MKKNLFNYLMIMIFMLFMAMPYVKAAPETIIVTGTDGPNGDTTYNVSHTEGETLRALYKTTGDDPVFCLKHSVTFAAGDFTKATSGEYYNVVENNKAALSYICAHGLGSGDTTYSEGDNNKDYIITNVAMWYFVDPTTWSATTIRNGINDGTYKYENVYTTASQKTADLIIAASNATGLSSAGIVGGGTSNAAAVTITPASSNMKLDADGLYYVSNPITFTNVEDDDNNLSVTVTGGAFLTTDKNATDGSATLTINKNATFYVKIAVSKVNKTSTSITVTATASVTNTGATTSYWVPVAYTNGSYQPIVYCDREAGTPTSSTDTKNATATFGINVKKITVTKTDMTGTKELAGARLVITKDGSSTFKETCTSSGDATKPCEFELGPGTYTLTEEIAPNGYIASSESTKFTINDDGTVTQDTYVMKNAPIIVKILKTNSTGKVGLVGAKLQILDKDGKLVTDLDGNKLEWNSEASEKSIHLGEGTYTLVEVEAPEGYELSDKELKFEVTKAGKVIVDKKEVKDNIIVFKNTPIPEQVPTGSRFIYVIFVGLITISGVTYFLFKKNII